MKIESRQQLVNEIAEALDMRLDEGCFYLNLTEQTVDLHISTAYADEECVWPHNGDKVIRIEALSSHESYTAMEKFSDKQTELIADKLYHALSGNRPFARFKETLDILNLSEEWYAFKNRWYAEKAKEWLQEEVVDFVDGKVVCSRNTMIWESDENE